MASPQDYTFMPWARRSYVASTSSDLSTSNSNMATPQRPNTEALIQQLTASHAAQQELEKRIADFREDQARRVNAISQRFEKKIDSLQRELLECQKREGAIQAVFAQNYEKEQELARKTREIEAKKAAMEEKQHLLEAREKDVAGNQQTNIDGGEPLTTPQQPSAQYENSNDDDDDDNYPGLDKTTFMCPLPSGQDLFRISPNHKRPKWFSDRRVELLRRHDYYKGWLDCMRAFNHEGAAQQGSLSADETKYLYDIRDARSPLHAGFNVGAVFAWSAFCTAHGVPQRDNRFDDRVWFLEDLVPGAQVQDLGFWALVKAGKEFVERLFLEKLESDRWECEEG